MKCKDGRGFRTQDEHTPCRGEANPGYDVCWTCLVGDAKRKFEIRMRAEAWVPHPEIEHIDDGVSYACSYCMRVETEEVLLESMRRNGIDDGVKPGE